MKIEIDKNETICNLDRNINYRKSNNSKFKDIRLSLISAFGNIIQLVRIKKPNSINNQLVKNESLDRSDECYGIRLERVKKNLESMIYSNGYSENFIKTLSEIDSIATKANKDYMEGIMSKEKYGKIDRNIFLKLIEYSKSTAVYTGDGDFFDKYERILCELQDLTNSNKSNRAYRFRIEDII